jgi:type II secretory pathway predicted ATPase ExeA
MERALVVQRAANKLFAAENAIDKALVDASALMIELQAVRQELNLSAIFADGASAKVVESMSALAQARTAMVACHAEMAEAKLRLGVRTKLAGVGDKPPANTAVDTRYLHEVG